MSSRARSPPIQCKEFLDAIDKGRGEASKWELIKIAGNETAFNRWVTDLLQEHRLVEKLNKGGTIIFRKTERGEVLHKTLKDWHLLAPLLRLSGKRLKSETQISKC